MSESVEIAEEAEEDSDGEALDMEDFDLEADDLVVGQKELLLNTWSLQCSNQNNDSII